MLCRFWGHICGFPRSVERLGARGVEVRDAVEGKGLDGIRIGAVCAERANTVLRKMKSWSSVGPCFRVY